MVDPETLSTIKRVFPWSSWAIWDDEFPDEGCIERSPDQITEFIMSHIDQLIPHIVFLGTNRSADLPAPFSNFHAPTKTHYDYRLKEFIQDGDLERLHGAYMTDLVDEVNSDQSGIEVTEEDARIFLEQLQLLGESEFHVICFGNKPFDGLVDYFGLKETDQQHEIKYAETEFRGFQLHLYRVWFYGLYGIYQDKVDVLGRQLQFLNQRIP